jgi:hypothetical protein
MCDPYTSHDNDLQLPYHWWTSARKPVSDHGSRWPNASHPMVSRHDGHAAWLVLSQGLMGHARTETNRGYSLPTAADAQAAINSLPANR